MKLIAVSFERLPVDAIDTLVKMLDEFRGDFLRQVSKSVSAYAANSYEAVSTMGGSHLRMPMLELSEWRNTILRV